VAGDDGGMVMRIEPVHELFGAEIAGVDLTRSLPEDDTTELRQLFASRSLLLFRGQELGHDDQRRLVETLGPISTTLLPPEARPGEASLGYQLSNEHGEGQGELRLHSDHCFLERPLWGISLYGQHVSPGCGATVFVSAVAAAERLAATERRRLAGLTARHVYRPRERRGEVRDPAMADELSATHHVLLAHPVTGTPLLYVNPWMTEEIVDGDGDGDETLRRLHEHLEQPAFRYTHHWQPHDFIVWDNLALLHGRTNYDPAKRRVLARLQLGLPEPTTDGTAVSV
jgi:taurine dioxygenase